MVYFSFDPRPHIRTAIGYTWDYDEDGTDESVVSVTNDVNDTVYIPLFLPGETRGEELEYMPFIDMVLVSSPAEAHHVGGSVREQHAYIDFNIWYTNVDDITPTVFGKTVADEVVDLIMTYRNSVTSAYFVEVVDDGRELFENLGQGVVYHRVVSIHAINYDNG